MAMQVKPCEATNAWLAFTMTPDTPELIGSVNIIYSNTSIMPPL